MLITQASEGPPNYAPSTASKGYLKGSPVWNKCITASSLSLINLKKCTIAFRSYVEMWPMLPYMTVSAYAKTVSNNQIRDYVPRILINNFVTI